MANTRKNGLSHQVLIKSIRSVNSQGGRLTPVIMGSFRVWNKHRGIQENLKDVITHAKKRLRSTMVGAIVYIRPLAGKTPGEALPIWQAKWGFDGKPFMDWKPNPVADYWKRKLGKEYSQKR